MRNLILATLVLNFSGTAYAEKCRYVSCEENERSILRQQYLDTLNKQAARCNQYYKELRQRDSRGEAERLEANFQLIDKFLNRHKEHNTEMTNTSTPRKTKVDASWSH